MPRTSCEQANRSLLQVCATTVCAVGMVLSAVSLAYAFTPGILPGENCNAPSRPPCFLADYIPVFYEENHQNITDAALGAVSFMPPSGGTPQKFTKPALRDVKDANAGVDYNQGAGSEKLHFDGGAFLAQSSQRLQRGKDMLIGQLNPSSTLSAANASNLRAVLGTLLHTLQDFYSHSNYASLAHPPIVQLGVTLLAPQDPNTTFPCDTFINSPPSDLNTSVLSGQFLDNLLTTGYAIGNLRDAEAPFGQCAHGFDRNGIHKDWSTRDKYRQAYAFAVDASKQFVQSIINDSANNPNNVCMLMTNKPCKTSPNPWVGTWSGTHNWCDVTSSTGPLPVSFTLDALSENSDAGTLRLTYIKPTDSRLYFVGSGINLTYQGNTAHPPNTEHVYTLNGNTITFLYTPNPCINGQFTRQ